MHTHSQWAKSAEAPLSDILLEFNSLIIHSDTNTEYVHLLYFRAVINCSFRVVVLDSWVLSTGFLLLYGSSKEDEFFLFHSVSLLVDLDILTQ